MGFTVCYHPLPCMMRNWLIQLATAAVELVIKQPHHPCTTEFISVTKHHIQWQNCAKVSLSNTSRCLFVSLTSFWTQQSSPVTDPLCPTSAKAQHTLYHRFIDCPALCAISLRLKQTSVFNTSKTSQVCNTGEAVTIRDFVALVPMNYNRTTSATMVTKTASLNTIQYNIYTILFSQPPAACNMFVQLDTWIRFLANFLSIIFSIIIFSFFHVGLISTTWHHKMYAGWITTESKKHFVMLSVQLLFSMHMWV